MKNNSNEHYWWLGCLSLGCAASEYGFSRSPESECSPKCSTISHSEEVLHGGGIYTAITLITWDAKHRISLSCLG